MTVVRKSAVLGAVAIAALLVVGTIVGAQGPNKCLAGKNSCASKKAQGLLKCHSKAEKAGTALDPACTQKVTDKFDGGPVPAKGCFAKLEAKNLGPCLTTNDTGSIEAKVDAFVLDVVQQLDPGYPTPVQNKCSAGKKKCVLKKVNALLKCHQKAAKAGTAVDAACLQKAKDKFDGGLVPAKGCFAKLEAKVPPCLTTGDTAALEITADAFVADFLDEINPPPTPTVTPTPGPTPTCAPGFAYAGALVPTVGRFNYALTLGLPGANAACSSNFAGSHVCTYVELQCAQAAGSLAGATDTAAALVTSFWAVDPNAPPLQQCLDDAVGGSNLPWEYATAHTASRGNKVALNNPAGTLGPLQVGMQCNFSGSSNVGCCQ